MLLIKNQGENLDSEHIDLESGAVLQYIEAVFRMKWQAKCTAVGLLPDDMLQSIYLSVLVRQQGKHPYDPAKAGQTTWLYKVIGSVCSGKIKVKRKANSRFQLGRIQDVALDGIDTSAESTEGALERLLDCP